MAANKKAVHHRSVPALHIVADWFVQRACGTLTGIFFWLLPLCGPSFSSSFGSVTRTWRRSFFVVRMCCECLCVDEVYASRLFMRILCLAASCSVDCCSTFEIHPLVCSCHPCSFPNDPVAGSILHDNGCMYPQSPFSNMLIVPHHLRSGSLIISSRWTSSSHSVTSTGLPLHQQAVHPWITVTSHLKFEFGLMVFVISQHHRKSLPCQAVELLSMAAVNSILSICNPRGKRILLPHLRKPLGRVFSNGRSHPPPSLLLGTHYLGSGEPRSVGL